MFRLHRGYHYPRDRATATECFNGFASFVRYYPEAVARQVPHFYAIAGQQSLTTPDQFEKHCADLGLWYRPARPPGLIPGSTAACYEVIESYYDPAALRKTCLERLDRSPVRVETGCRDSPAKIAARHDVVVVAAYASLNRVLAALGCPPVLLQHEACEVAVMHAPELRRYSLVVMDGPFVSLAPYGTDRFLLYDVDHSVQARETGTGSGTAVAGQKVTSAFGKMLESARRFVPVGDVQHEWSFSLTGWCCPARTALMPVLRGCGARRGTWSQSCRGRCALLLTPPVRWSRRSLGDGAGVGRIGVKCPRDRVTGPGAWPHLLRGAAWLIVRVRLTTVNRASSLVAGAISTTCGGGLRVIRCFCWHRLAVTLPGILRTRRSGIPAGRATRTGEAMTLTTRPSISGSTGCVAAPHNIRVRGKGSQTTAAGRFTGPT